MLLSCSLVNAADTISEEEIIMQLDNGLKNEVGEEVEPSVAVLFPWFTELLGVVVFLLLTRYAHALPYTAVLFLLGTFMGVGTSKLGLSDQLTESIRMWDFINGDLLLSVFLPGLVFRDAYGLNVHLFQLSFYQCLIMAFPLVLAGTALTACVAFYIFPFGWSFNLAMTFGAILSATDPVAVNALLNEVGAPPRLKTHIAGESLLNDGSSIVFYTIFSLRFLHEIGIEGLGEDVDLGEGFALFFREALGGVLVGLVFAIGLVTLLHQLDRRLNAEENVVQVAATVTVAYLTYYTADSVLEMSGVIAVVFCGLGTKALGADKINDKSIMDGFWNLLEHLLNTVLFALGGVVWGFVISTQDERSGLFGAQEWGYLILLYVLLTVIRFGLFFASYPILSRMGLGTNLRETTFISYGGLRGAVGIALAISLDNEVFSVTTNETYRTFTTQLFGFVGGIAFMTLVRFVTQLYPFQ
jgi:NhaP-type Na+/H+ or K+/H+ antiporter